MKRALAVNGLEGVFFVAALVSALTGELKYALVLIAFFGFGTLAAIASHTATTAVVAGDDLILRLPPLGLRVTRVPLDDVDCEFHSLMIRFEIRGVKGRQVVRLRPLFGLRRLAMALERRRAT